MPVVRLFGPSPPHRLVDDVGSLHVHRPQLTKSIGQKVEVAACTEAWIGPGHQDALFAAEARVLDLLSPAVIAVDRFPIAAADRRLAA